jgi:O-antigen/teichoic acid export membrane protein
MTIKELINNSQSRFVFVTFGISAIGFLKTFFLLKIFNFNTLGIIALAQTFSSTISLMQLGVVTGGYRLFSYKKDSVLEKINSAVLFFFLLLIVLLCFLGIITDRFFNLGISLYLVLFFIIIGVTSLYSNWVICKLLGSKNLIVVNKVQIASSIISFIVTLSAKWFGLPAVLAALLLQPVIIIVVAYLIIPRLIPRISFISFKKYIKRIISLGFIPYLTSALTLFNSQLGRWLITFSLGTLILGKIFLPSLFAVLISVFPGAISSLFFPSIIEKFELNQKEELSKIIKKQFILLASYFCTVSILTLLCIDVVIKAFLPKHFESINLIYAILPSLVFIHMSGPAINLFNGAKKFNHILIGGLISVISYCLLLVLYLYLYKPQLIWFFVIESISAFLFFMYNIFYFIKLNKSLSYVK